MSKQTDLIAADLGESYPEPRRVPLSWFDLADWLWYQMRGLRALERAERLAAVQAEDLRIARNRIANAADRARAAKRLLGIGDTAEATNEVARALDYLTFGVEVDHDVD